MDRCHLGIGLYILFKDCCRSAQTRRDLLICGFFGLSNHTFFIT